MPQKTFDKTFVGLHKELDSAKFLENVKSNFKDFPDPRASKSRIYPM